MTSTDLVVADISPPGALVGVDPDEMIGMQPTIDYVSIPSGGGLAFAVPGADGTPTAVPFIEGVILHHHAASVTWFDRMEESADGAQPDARSNDGVRQELTERGRNAGMTELLASCPANQFGYRFDQTAQKIVRDPAAHGKVTTNQRKLFILRLVDGALEAFPICLTLSPMSMKPFDNWFVRGALPHGGASAVVVKIGLTQEKNKAGTTYSRATFSTIAKVPDGAREALEGQKLAVKALASQAPVVADEAAAVVEPTGAVAEFASAFDATPVPAGNINDIV